MKHSIVAESAQQHAAVVLDVQYASHDPAVPTRGQFLSWAERALADQGEQVELVIRVVDSAESQALNRQYRGRDCPTNVLSFPFDSPPGVGPNHLGDLVICAPVVHAEARDQGKPEEAHWAHMVLHGVLHLRGYDHQSEDDAVIMESLETAILKSMGYNDPYS